MTRFYISPDRRRGWLSRGQLYLTGLSLLTLLGCSTSPEAAISPPAVLSRPGQPITAVAKALATQPTTTPVLIGLALDYSGSIHDNHLPLVEINNLDPLFQLLTERGGELAIALVCEDTSASLLRMRVETQPRITADQFVNPPEPIPLDENINPIQRPQALRDYAEASARHEELQAEDLQRLKAHNTALAAHRQAATNTVKAFREKVGPVLSQPANCQTTNLNGNLARLDLFLSEDSSSWPTSPRRVLIAVTDGLDTTGKAPAPLNSNPEIALVNGSGSQGVLKNLPHKPFENFSAALTYLIHSQNQHH
ncbi:hypothetical protein [Adonisia turfae]|uniref:VWFA domain-containing protein n=1 Tax=Adonisia turfae CCMR0081 TaxID=2292702 RepID=A0A6M0RXT5_9CYAN|nr:hypothetical protein [Adonisia turfae]NEZ61047.1 hypothetical protein [Adonisia turfae CCMR0081]